MDRLVSLGSLSFTILPEQVQALNPIMVMCMIPLTSMFLYPSVERLGFEMTPLRRMGLGMFIMTLICYCCNRSKNRSWSLGIYHVASCCILSLDLS